MRATTPVLQKCFLTLVFYFMLTLPRKITIIGFSEHPLGGAEQQATQTHGTRGRAGTSEPSLFYLGVL